MAELPSEAEGRALFGKLKPLCVQVMSSPSLESLSELREGLSGLLGPSLLHPQLVDYVLLPVRMIMNKFGSTNLRLLEGGLVTLEAVLSHVRGLDKWELFHNLLVYLCMMLDSKMAKEAGFTERSEDLVLVCVRALRALLLSPSENVCEAFLSHLPAVGHCVSVLLETLQAYSSKSLRHEALSTLLALTGVNAQALTLTLKPDETTSDHHSDSVADDLEIDDKSVTPNADVCAGYLDGLVQTLGVGPKRCGHVFAAFLPGISVAIAKLVTTETNLGSSVTLLCLLMWAHYVAMVTKDSECSIESNAVGTVTETEREGKRLEVKRTLAWQQETDSKLCMLVQRMSGLVTSEGWRVRVGVLGWAHVLLSHSYRTLTTSTPYLLESLVTLSHDDYPLVSNSAHHVITIFSHHYDNDQSNTKLTSLLEGRVHSLCSALPRLMRQMDDKRKIATLQLLSGYLRLLGSHVISLTHSHPHLSRLTIALVQTLEVQVPDTRIVEHPLFPASLESKPTPSTPSQPTTHSSTTEPTSKRTSQTPTPDTEPNDLSPHMSKLALRFVHFRDERIEGLLYNICRLLGRHGNLQVVVDHLMDLYRSSFSQQKELLLILSHVLDGAKKSGGLSSSSSLSSGECGPLVEGLVLQLVETSQQETTPTRDLWAEERPLDQQDRGLHSCLLLNTILICASILETTFDPLLQHLAYPLMQWLGDSDPSISSYARGVVLSIATISGYKSVQELITANADYLVNSTALNLRSPSHLSHHLQATHVLQAILTHGDKDVLPLMRDSLDELLFSLDARRQSPAHIWPTLHTLSDSCLRWSSSQPLLPPKDFSATKSGIEEILKSSFNRDAHPPQPLVSPDDIKKFFLDYHKRKEVEEQGDQEEEVEGGVSEEESPYSQKRELPPVTQAAMSVIQRCVHHLSSPTQQVQLLILEALANCILSLKHDQDTLLPEVHNVWAPFLPRLSDPSPPVAVRAWRVMLVMCDACGGFLRKRIVEKVWPPLVKALQSLAPKSFDADSLYKQTVQYKLQQCLLACVSTLCVKLEVPTTDLETLAHASLPYLSRDQPPGLQETCVNCFRKLISYDPDVMWLLLQQLCPRTVCTPTHSLLKQYAFRDHKESEMYADNVQGLLMFCSEC